MRDTKEDNKTVCERTKETEEIVVALHKTMKHFFPFFFDSLARKIYRNNYILFRVSGEGLA